MPVPIAELFVSVGADISGATAGLNSLNSQIQKVGSGFNLAAAGRGVQHFGNLAQTAGRDLTGALTAPILGIGFAAFNAGSDFEHSFTQVKRTVDGLDTTQLEELRQSLIEMSTGPAGGLKTASELADIAAVGGQLGLAGGDIKDFTSLVARLAAATNLPAGQIAEDVGRSINVMNLASKDYEAFGSVITDLGNKFGGTEADIFEFSRRLGGTLSALGVKPHQIEAIGAALSAAGVNPEAGGTAINQFFVDMVNSLNETSGASEKTKQKIQNLKDSISDLSNNLEVAQLRQKEFGRNTPASVVKANQIAIDKYQRELGQANTKLDNFSQTSADGKLSIAGMAKVAGVSEDAFRALVKTDPARAFASFVAGLKNIQETGGGDAVTKTLEKLGITGDRQREVMLGLANSLQDVTTALDIADAAWADPVALAKENAKIFEDTQNKITLAVNQGTAELIKAYDKQKESIQQLIDSINNDLLPAFKRITDLIPTLTPDQIKFFAAVAAVGPALLGLGVVISGIGAVMGLLASPVALVAIAAIAGSALVIDDVANHWEEFKNQLNQIPVLRGVVAVIDLFKTNGDQIKASLAGIITSVGTWGDDLNRKIASAVFGAGEIFSAFGTFLSQFFDTVILPILGRFKGWIQEKIIGAFIGILEFLKTLGITNLPGFDADIGTMIDKLKAAQTSAAGGGGGGSGGFGNGVNVTINNPQVTSQGLLDRLSVQVANAVTTAMVTAEKSVVIAPQPLPGQVPGSPF